MPDYAGEENLAGALSRRLKCPLLPVVYIGPLTRCYKKETAVNNELLILLSGPEPQRTLLEDILLRELQNYHEPVLFVRGLPGDGKSLTTFNQVRFHNHLSSKKLNDAMNASKLIIARSGYSTIMDAMELHKTCIFIPTPGQSEQLYLAEYLSGKKRCISFIKKIFV